MEDIVNIEREAHHKKLYLFGEAEDLPSAI
jgi:hypothetical protein